MVNHIVMFRLDGDAPSRHDLALRFKNAIEALPFQIDELVDIRVDLNENPAEQWDMVLTARVNTWEDLPLYANNKAHLACVELIKHNLIGRACVDYADN